MKKEFFPKAVLWRQVYRMKEDAHFQLYVNDAAYLKAAGQLQ